MNDGLLTDVFRAYYDARKHKRNTLNQLNFEMDLEHNLVELAHQIRDRTYSVSPSVCFMVTKPVNREIFAADFRDRVVHHLLINYIGEIVERSLITDCYACRKGYGTSYGVQRIKHHIHSCTGNYTRRAYVLKMDIQGYFMSIDRELLFRKMEALLLKYANRKSPKGIKWKEALNLERISYLLKVVVFNDPTAGCRVKGNRKEWEGLPLSKSLFHSPPGCGLPIGNLTSQVFSNVYLSDFDHYVKRTLRMEHYGRYVDDFYVIHRDKEVLKQLPLLIAHYLWEELKLTLHPKKIVLQDVIRGIGFLGVYIKPYREHLVRKSQKSICRSVYQLEHAIRKKKKLNKKEKERIRASMNSYLGYLTQYNTYKLRKRLVEQCTVIREQGTFTPEYSKIMT